jgi:molybdopterin synthase sulfur carrier subunit
MSAQKITVRYWAAARAAAGTDRDELAVEGPVTLSEVVRQVVAAHPEGRCSSATVR